MSTESWPLEKRTQEALDNASYPLPILSSLPSTLEKFFFKSAAKSLEANQLEALTTESRLPEIDSASLSLYCALHYFRPVDDRYASKSVEEAFNWKELLLPEGEEREWYCVVFRSKKTEGYDKDKVSEADRKVHEEAVRYGGLLMYWYGIPDPETGFNLAVHIWRSRKHAIAVRPHHTEAKQLAKEIYDVFSVERFVLRKRRGTQHVALEKYLQGDVGW